MTGRHGLVVLVSGGGSNLQALVDAGLPVRAVVSNRPDAFALQRATHAGIPTRVVERQPAEARSAYDERLAEAVAAFDPEWVVLAGWMRLLSVAFLSRFTDRVINLHPALPGELPGLHAIERAHAQAVAGARTHSGVMVHLVPDEGIDSGPVLAYREVPVSATDTFDAFAARMHAAEHELLVSTLQSLDKEQHVA